MTRGYLDEPSQDSDYLEFHGTLVGSTAKAYKFEADTWGEPLWVPKSQAKIIEMDEATKRCTMHIAKWLCQKNNWKEF